MDNSSKNQDAAEGVDEGHSPGRERILGWAASRRAELLAEEAIFAEAIACGTVQAPAAVTELLRGGSLVNSAALAGTRDQFDDAVDRFVAASTNLARVAALPTADGHERLSALREVVFQADSRTAEINFAAAHPRQPDASMATIWQRLFRWMRDPVGSGSPEFVSDIDLHFIYRFTALLRLAGAVSTAVLVTFEKLNPAILILVFSVATSGLLRFATNAETGVSLRARYVSCIAGHLGDVLVLLAASSYASRQGYATIAACGVGSTVLMLFGSLMRTGVLSAGVHVPRVRVERLIRVGSMIAGLVVTSLGEKYGLCIAFAGVSGWSLLEIVKVIKAGLGSTATQIAWFAGTGDEGGYSGRIETAPGLSDVDWLVMAGDSLMSN